MFMMEISFIEFFGAAIAILSFGIALGRFVGKIESCISEHKNNRPSA